MTFRDMLRQELSKKVIAGLVLLAVFAGGGLWWLITEAKLTPVLARDLEPWTQQIAANTEARLWIKHDNYKKRLLNGGRLSGPQCREYRHLAKILGVPALPC